MWGQEDWWKGIQSKNGANALIGLGTGLLQGNTFAKGLAAGGQGFMQGAELDQQYADAEAEKLKQTEQGNVTRSWLEQQGYTDLVPLVDAGQAGLAYSEALKRMQPKAAPEGFTLGPGEARYQGGQLIAQGAPDQGDAFGYEKDLYSQYSAAPPVKLYQEVKSGFERVRTSAVQNTGAGDVGLIYGYMKMLDPGSVVREGEFATAESTAGVPQQIVGLYNKLISGERLTPQQKAQFVQAAEGLYGETVQNLEGINQQFSTRAQGWNVNPGNFIVQPEAYDPVNMGAQADPLGLR